MQDIVNFEAQQCDQKQIAKLAKFVPKTLIQTYTPHSAKNKSKVKQQPSRPKKRPRSSSSKKSKGSRANLRTIENAQNQKISLDKRSSPSPRKSRLKKNCRRNIFFIDQQNRGVHTAKMRQFEPESHSMEHTKRLNQASMDKLRPNTT